MTDLECFQQAVDKAIQQERQHCAEKGYTYSHKGYSYGMVFNAAMAQETTEAAQRFLRGYIEHLAPTWESEMYTPAEGALVNLGYMAGYYGDEIRHKIEWLYGAQHPIFGSATPTTWDAFTAGVAAAQGASHVQP